MWFHKTCSFGVGDNVEPSISTVCAVTSEHLKLINCARYKRIRKLFFMSSQCKALNNLRANAIHRHCCLRGIARKYGTAGITPSSGAVASAPDPRLQLSHWLH